MQVVVTNCQNCPFHIIDGYYQGYCHHPKEQKCGQLIGDYESDTPDWCKLAKEPLIITKPTNTKTQTYMTIKPDENEQWTYM